MAERALLILEDSPHDRALTVRAPRQSDLSVDIVDTHDCAEAS